MRTVKKRSVKAEDSEAIRPDIAAEFMTIEPLFKTLDKSIKILPKNRWRGPASKR
jgi:hypothetical protein